MLKDRHSLHEDHKSSKYCKNIHVDYRRQIHILTDWRRRIFARDRNLTKLIYAVLVQG